jgi:tetratricopeptide (TPR) repeat protein
MRGVAKFKKGDTGGGQADIAAAKAIQSNITEVLAQLGVSSVDLTIPSNGQVLASDPDHQIADANAAIQRNPKDALAYAKRGSAYAAKGDFDHAIADFDTAVRFDPTEVQAISGRATAYQDKGQYDLSLKDYDKLVRLQPNVALWWNNRCWVRTLLAQPLAITDCDEAITINPNDARNLDTRGFANFKLGEHNHAIADYDAALKIDPRLYAGGRQVQNG